MRLSFSKQNLPANISVLFTPLISLFILVVLIIVSLKIGYSRIALVIKSLNESKSTVTGLEQKLEVLNRLEGVVLTSTDYTVAALPGENSGLMVLSQLRALSQDRSVSLLDVHLSDTTSQLQDSGVSVVAIEFNLIGERSNISELLKSISGLSPVSTIKSIDISGSGNVDQASIELTAYWARFPEVLPAITQPVDEFTPQEEELIVRLSSLSLPDLLDLSPSASVERPNPFGI